METTNICDWVSDPRLIVSICALIVSLTAIATSWVALSIQRKHYRKTLMPIIFISAYDYSNRIIIKIKNEGTGPAIVKRTRVNDEKGNVQPHIYGWLPKKLPGTMKYAEYWTRSEDFVLRAGLIEHMLEIPINTAEDYQVKERDSIRETLSQLTMHVEYCDVYGNEMSVYSRKLDLFKRQDHDN